SSKHPAAEYLRSRIPKVLPKKVLPKTSRHCTERISRLVRNPNTSSRAVLPAIRDVHSGKSLPRFAASCGRKNRGSIHSESVPRQNRIRGHKKVCGFHAISSEPRAPLSYNEHLV